MADKLRPLQATDKLPTAIFVVNDLYAFRLIKALELLGLKVPRDISVIGFDDMEPGSLEESMLTTVRQPFMEIGRAAARLLMQRLEEPDAPTCQVLLRTHLVQRSSVRNLSPK